jgi:hypothetical protein
VAGQGRRSNLLKGCDDALAAKLVQWPAMYEPETIGPTVCNSYDGLEIRVEVSEQGHPPARGEMGVALVS